MGWRGHKRPPVGAGGQTQSRAVGEKRRDSDHSGAQTLNGVSVAHPHVYMQGRVWKVPSGWRCGGAIQSSNSEGRRGSGGTYPLLQKADWRGSSA